MSLRDIEWEYGARRFINLGHRPASVMQGVGIVVNSQAEFDALTITSGANITLSDTFYGSLTIDQPNVTISGGGLKGSQEVTGWSDEGGGIYSKVMSEPKWVYIDGQDAKLAQSSNPVTITGTPSDTTITASGITGTIDGSILIHVPDKFVYSTEFKVISESSGTITLDRDYTTDGYDFDNGNVCQLFGLQSYIINNYDWAYESGTLYIKLPSAPANYTIKAVLEDYGINITGDNCTINGVAISEYKLSGIQCLNGNDSVSLINCNIYNIRQDGIFITEASSGITISGNNIYNCGTNGVRLAIAQNSTITQNTVYNIGTQETIGWYAGNHRTSTYMNQIVGTGLQIGSNQLEYTTAYSNNITVTYNTIYNLAYCGIHTGKGMNHTISYNIIHDAMKSLHDGAAIYSYFYKPDYPNVSTGHTITYNYIYDIAEHSYDRDGGIYMDTRSVNNEIGYNMLNNCGNYGVFINADTSLINIHHNVICRAERAIYFYEWASPNRQYNNDKHLLNNNIIAVGSTSHVCVYVNTTHNPYANGGSADNNIYINPYTTAIGNLNNVNKTLSQLQTALSQDALSSEISNYISAPGTPSTNIKFIVNATSSTASGNLNDYNYIDTSGDSATNYSLLAWSAAIYLQDWINTYSMVVDATGEGIKFTDTSLDLTDGSGNDESVSFEFWYKLNATGSGRIIMSTIDNADSYCQIGIGATGRLYGKWKTDASNTLQKDATPTTFADTNWHHVIITYDGSGSFSGIKIYADGSEVTYQGDISSGTYSGIPAGGDGFRLEVPRNTSGFGYGKYNLFRLYRNRVLSSADVTTRYNSGIPIPDPDMENLTIEHRFNNTTDSDYGLAATAVGTPTFDTDIPT